MQSLDRIGQAPYVKAVTSRKGQTHDRPSASHWNTVKLIGNILLDISTFFVLLIPILADAIGRLFRKAEKKSIVGQTALVTGGANGLGRDLCLQLASAGCHVAVVDLDESNGKQTTADIRRLGVKAHFFKADVSSYEAVVALRTAVSQKLGPVDILINNAGVLPLMSLREGTPNDLRKVIEINLLSHLWMLRTFLNDMIERKRGHIVAIASITSYLPAERIIAYVASKYGVRGLMGSFASELHAEGLDDVIKTTTVYPCFIKTRHELMEALSQMRIKHRVPIMESHTVARAIVGAILYNKSIVFLPKVIGPFAWIYENLPSPVAHLAKRCFLRTSIPNVMVDTKRDEPAFR
ncbi:17-beta-hydroxysteroid dehydrogenase 13-like [Anopheles darlingi]|uniref:17-beta-hydroxysteroid dehydrogenase 13-like n=1 Tax=Anopheles darlingi TaxID=43151 RepID=UPI002100440D|nr:17-beta-hydroxysteroid dehydrogenase 13-like [Anopheles darlingi]